MIDFQKWIQWIGNSTPTDVLKELTGWVVAAPLVFMLALAFPLILLWAFRRITPSTLMLRWTMLLAAASLMCLQDLGVRVVGGLSTAIVAVVLVKDWWPRWDTVPRLMSRAVAWTLIVLALIITSFPISILVWDLTLLIVGFFDLLLLPSIKRIEVSRQTQRVASLKKKHLVELTVVNGSRRKINMLLVDDRPQSWEVVPNDFDLRIAPMTRMVFDYRITPSLRGSFLLEWVFLLVRSPLSLWNRSSRLPVRSEIKVFPDLAQLRDYAILARTNRLRQMGVRRTRRIGQDNEFERLRDYSVDDNFRHIEWRATARRNRLTVKDFQANQSQRLIFMLDCGRMMTNECKGIPLLDHAMNAMLMASYVALQQGDSVGLLCFSDRIHSFVPPKGGMKQMNQLLHAVFDQHARLVESRYDEAFLHLRTQCHKRSLVVLMTNVVDEVNAWQVTQYLSSLVGRHLPLGVFLRDHSVFDRADRQPQDELEYFQAAAAAEVLNWRQDVLTNMTHRGVLAIDSFPEDLSAPLVNEYLQIKARHLL